MAGEAPRCYAYAKRAMCAGAVEGGVTANSPAAAGRFNHLKHALGDAPKLACWPRPRNAWPVRPAVKSAGWSAARCRAPAEPGKGGERLGKPVEFGYSGNPAQGQTQVAPRREVRSTGGGPFIAKVNGENGSEGQDQHLKKRRLRLEPQPNHRQSTEPNLGGGHGRLRNTTRQDKALSQRGKPGTTSGRASHTR